MVEDLVMLTQEDLLQLNGLHDTSLSEIKENLDALGLSLRPRSIRSSHWQQILDEKRHQKDVEEIEPTKDSFEILLDTPIKELPLINRAYLVLARNNIHDVGTLVQITDEQLSSFRNVGVTIRDNIVETLAKLNLRLRPNEIAQKDWLVMLKANYAENAQVSELLEPVRKEEEVKKIDFRTIPAEYRENVAANIGDRAMEQTRSENNVYDILISRALRNKDNHNVRADKRPTVKTDYVRPELTYEEKVKFLRDNPEILSDYYEGK